MRWTALALVVACGACTEADPDELPTEQTLWRNGNYGAWEFDNGATYPAVAMLTSGTMALSVATADELTGGTPSLQLTCSNLAGCRFEIMLDAEADPGGTTDLARFAGGHLRFDLQLLDLDATDVQVRLFDPLDVAIPAAALDGSWTAVSLALTPDLYGSDGPQDGALTTPAPVFSFAITPSVEEGNRPMALLNDIRWTVD